MLVENFSPNFLLAAWFATCCSKKTTDIDITTQGKPEEVSKLLKLAGITTDDKYKNFGVIVAKHGGLQVEIATFRKDLQNSSRYANVVFINNPKIDSLRRDFTINSLYLNGITGQILDFNEGIKDLKIRHFGLLANPKIELKKTL